LETLGRNALLISAASLALACESQPPEEPLDATAEDTDDDDSASPVGQRRRPCPEGLEGDLLLADVGLRIDGRAVSDNFGSAVVGLGDVSGDGLGDFAVGVRGASSTRGGASVFLGGREYGSAAKASANFEGGTRAAWFTGNWAAPSGDGALMVSAPGAGGVAGDLPGTVFVLDAAATGDATFDTARATIAGADGRSEDLCVFRSAGAEPLQIAGGSDVDGDGVADVLVGAAGPPLVDGPGRAHLYLGPLEGELGPADASAVIVGPSECSFAGWPVAMPGDLDGDGFGDLLIGALGVQQVAVFHGPLSGEVAWSEASLLVESGVGALAMHSVDGGPDITGDGRPDLIVPWVNTSTKVEVAVYLVAGDSTGTVRLEEDAIKLTYGGLDPLRVGAGRPDFAVTVGGDFDGDGYPDLAIGDWTREYDGIGNAGAVYLFYGPVSEDRDLTFADAVLYGPPREELPGGGRAAWSIDFADDLDGDGLDDLLVGAPELGAEGGWSPRGAAYVVYGRKCERP